ncbi:MAG: hypothetical protein QOD42_3676 [Sphingomonadales bacterium]|jgi:UDP-glucose 4-epimerase|nr:hypothetical protein [Sphingomonadales bacterium]
MRPVLLVTGATGFIGRALLRQIEQSGLRQSCRVLLVASRPIPGWEVLEDKRRDGLYSFSERDFADLEVEAVQSIIHLGAFTPKSGASANDVDGAFANIANTRHLVGNAPGSGSARFVFLSSIDVYGRSIDPVTEEHICRPETLYGRSKLFCEQLLEALSAQAEIGELQVLRIGHTYGAGEESYRKFIPETVRRILNGEGAHFFTTGEERRSFIHVDDCARMILAGLTSPGDIGPITVASRHRATLREVADQLAEAAAEATGRKPVHTEQPEIARGDDVVFEVAKMERWLGLEHVPLGDGLREEFLHMSKLR